MSNPVSKLLEIARAEIGYRERRSGSTWTNRQKYSPAVPGLEWSQNQAWCSTFLSWVAMQAGLAELYPRTASTDAGAAWFKARGQWHDYPAVGAFGYLGTRGDMFHVFVVDRFDDTYIWTIEGNTNDTGSPQGDGVYTLRRRRDSASIEGYGYPALPGLVSADPAYARPAEPKPPAPSRPGRADVVAERRHLTRLARKLAPGRLREKVRAARDFLPKARR